MVGVRRRRTIRIRRHVHQNGNHVVVVVVRIIGCRPRDAGLRIRHKTGGEITVLDIRIIRRISRFIRRHGKPAVILLVSFNGRDNGAHLRLGLGYFCSVFHFDQHRQQHRRQNADDGNDDQQFDKGERRATAV